MNSEKIDDIRRQIDLLDEQLLEVFNQRARLVVELARIKKKMGLKLFDPEREREIFERMSEANPGPLTEAAIVRLYERLIDESRRLERTEVYNKKSK